MLFERSSHINLVATSQYADDIVPLVQRHVPDILLLDIHVKTRTVVGNVSSLTTIPRLLQQHPNLKVVVLSADRSSVMVDAALGFGVSAFILKDEIVENGLPIIIERVYHGIDYISPQLQATLAAQRSKYTCLGLKRQHIRHMRIVAQYPDCTDYQLAEILGVSQGTVRNQRSEVCRILGTRTPRAALLLLLERGIVETANGVTIGNTFASFA